MLEQTTLETLLLNAVGLVDPGSLYDYDTQDWMQTVPTLDLAVIVFPEHNPPIYANVIRSRSLPHGHIVKINPDSLTGQGIRWRQDRGPNGRWDESVWTWTDADDLLPGTIGIDFISPYPASVLKLLVGVEILFQVDAGRLTLDQPVTHTQFNHQAPDPKTQSIQTWLEQMLQVSDDRATFALIQQLHRIGSLHSQEVDPDLPCVERVSRQEKVNQLNYRMAQLGLTTLQLNQTRGCDGSFYNRAGCGVGHCHMTAWDTARLLWLLDPVAPKPTWQTPNGKPVDVNWLSPTSKQFLIHDLLAQQGFHDVLSRTALCGHPNFELGIPAVLPSRWILPNGQVILPDNDLMQTYSTDVRPCNAAAEVSFAHKTGLTTNYGSDVGIVIGIRGYKRHYIITLFSNLGYRYTDCWLPGDLKYAAGIERVLWYPQVLGRIGSMIDRELQTWLEDPELL